MKRSSAPALAPLITLLALSSAALAACQTQPDRHLGDSLDDRTLELVPPTEPNAPAEPFGVPRAEFVGRWVGVAEDPLAFGGPRDAYVFPSGSAEFHLEIAPPDDPRDNLLHGTLVFGAGAPLPPLDPELGPPIDVAYAQLAYLDRDAVTASDYRGPLPPLEGHPYLIQSTVQRTAFDVDEDGNPLVMDGVLELEFDTTGFIAPWCALQEPRFALGPEPYSCVKGNTAGTSDTGECYVGFAALTPELEAEVLASGETLSTETVDCNKYFLCASRVCVCDEDSCYFDVFNRRSLGRLTLRREGDTLSGAFSNVAFFNERQLPVPLGTLRFTRIVD